MGLDKAMYEELVESGSVAAGTYKQEYKIKMRSNTKFDLSITDKVGSASSSFEPLVLNTVMAVAGGVGGRAHFKMETNVVLGGWSNALKASVTYGAAGRTTGLGSAFCAELTLSAGTASGTYAVLEAELVMPAGAVVGSGASFLFLSASGAAVTTFDAGGYLFTLQGVASGAANLWYDHQGTAPTNVEEWLKVKTPAGVRWLALYNAVV